MSPDFLYKGNKFLGSLSPVKFNFEGCEGINVGWGFWQAGAHTASEVRASVNASEIGFAQMHIKR